MSAIHRHIQHKGIKLNKHIDHPTAEEKQAAFERTVNKLSENNQLLAKYLNQFMTDYKAAQDLAQRKDLFGQCRQSIQQLTDESGLPEPAELTKIVRAIFYNYRFFYDGGEEQMYAEHNFFTEAVLTKMLQAIQFNRPIVEIGPGASCLAITAALLGADVIGVESSDCQAYYIAPYINIDGLAPVTDTRGSFQMHDVTGLPHITVSQHNNTENLNALLQPYLRELEQTDGEPLSQEIINNILHYLRQRKRELSGPHGHPCLETIFGGSKPTYTFTSNTKAIEITEAIKSLLRPGDDLSQALVIGAMLPPTAFGIGYVLNRLENEGAELLIWGDSNNQAQGVTAVLPSPNIYRIRGRVLLAIDPKRRVKKEDLDKFRNQPQMEAIKQAPFGFHALGLYAIRNNIFPVWSFSGQRVNELAALRQKYGLEKSTPRSLNYPDFRKLIPRYNKLLDQHHFEASQFMQQQTKHFCAASLRTAKAIMTNTRKHFSKETQLDTAIEQYELAARILSRCQTSDVLAVTLVLNQLYKKIKACRQAQALLKQETSAERIITTPRVPDTPPPVSRGGGTKQPNAPRQTLTV